MSKKKLTTEQIVQKLWKLCDVLRDDGVNYSEYVTELVLLLFIKMEQEMTNNNVSAHKLPEGCRWTDLNSKSGLKQMDHYRQMLLDLGKSDDSLLRAIYANANTSLKEPRHLSQLVTSIDEIDWFSAREDGLGDLYEGLLEKNASETKSGAGQYFTPRVLIDCIVRLMQPLPGETIQDPAAGTAGFLIAADRLIKDQTDELFDLEETKQDFQKNKAFIGMELVPNTRRLALMNCLLHDMEGDHEGVVHLGNTLGNAGTQLPKVDLILSNPPFGTAKGGGGPTRDDLTFATSNKQLAFLQHIYRHLKPGGRAAVVLPDNVLFEAGMGADIRKDLMDKCNLHTILRLPTGIFYAQGVKTNVLFFQKGSTKDPRQETGCTKTVWVYDLRTNMPSFGKRSPFSTKHLAPFEKAYGTDKNGQSARKENVEGQGETSRFRKFARKWIAERDNSLDISWLKDDSVVEAADLPEPDVLAAEAMQELGSAFADLNALMVSLGANETAKKQCDSMAKTLKKELVVEGDAK